MTPLAAHRITFSMSHADEKNGWFQLTSEWKSRPRFVNSFFR
jgi:hypothetical protein